MDTLKRYQEAVESFTNKVKNDPNVIAVFLAGSLAYDKVWEKSDVDMTVIIRDQEITTYSYAIDEDDIIINVGLTTRTKFKKMLGSSKGGGITHSMISRGKFLYTTDDSLNEALEDFKKIGADDMELSFFVESNFLIGVAEKIEKWLTVKEDPLYAQLYVVFAANQLANMKLISLGISPSRESVLQVMEIDPDFIRPFYEAPLSGRMTEEHIRGLLVRIYGFLEEHADYLFAPAEQYMSDGEIKTVTMLTKKFGLDSHAITHIFDFLAKIGKIDKVSETIRITPKGKKLVEEVAYIKLI